MSEALILPILLYLVGHFLARSLTRKGDGWAELALLRVAASAAVALPVLTLLALAGRFTVPVIAASLGVCVVVAWALTYRANGAVRFTRWDLGALGIVAGGVAMYARPAEYVINSRDPGVYALFAARLARTGELIHRDPLAGAVAPFHPFLEGNKYPGFYIHAQDLVVPQFFPGPFAFLGLGGLVGGTWGTLYVVPILGALSVGMAFVLGRELFGPWAGLLGATLLAAGFAQVWWARHPSSEVMAQFFVLAGLWFSARFARGAGPSAGVLAGLLLGAAMLVRVDAFLAATAVPLLFGYDLLTRRPALRWLYPGVPLTLFAGASLLYLNTVGGRYLNLIYSRHGVDHALELLPHVLGVAASALAVFFLARHLWGERLGGWLEVRGSGSALAGAVVVAGLALWAYFVLPEPWESLPQASREFDAYRSQVVVRMVWFTTPLVALLGLAGFLLAAYRLDARKVLLLGAVLSFGVLYVALPNVAPDLPWATRRFVPVVFPGLCLLAGYAAVEAGRFVGRVLSVRSGIAFGCALAALAFGWTVYAMFPILGTREYGGAVAAFDRIEDEMPDAEVVFVETPDGSDLTASTFEYAYGHPVLPYDRVRFIREVDDLEEVGLLADAVYVTTDGKPAPLVSGVDFRQVGSAELELPRLVRTEGHEPRLSTEVETLRKSYRVFRIEEDR
ncbi:MAG TPA: glycosyltransferase family 39 protein [Rubrobacteraceae bacterium]|nr:glycosyltransferase family 39 protein [Rubrobacteraceae bacterium]